MRSLYSKPNRGALTQNRGQVLTPNISPCIQEEVPQENLGLDLVVGCAKYPVGNCEENFPADPGGYFETGTPWRIFVLLPSPPLLAC